MTRDKAIAELVRIWNSPHLDLSLKAGLGEAIEALQAEMEGDLISRGEAVALVNRAIRGIDDKDVQEYLFDGLRKQMWALPSANCDDCIWHTCNYNKVDWDGEEGYISRQDALDILDDFEADIELGKRDSYKAHREKLLSLPSAEPKTGEWMKVIDEETPNVTKWHYECDQCGAGRFENGQQYCSRCGARMLGEDGEA